MFTVANSIANSPIKMYIDVPNASSAPVHGVTSFAGWAVDSNTLITAVEIVIDGVPYGPAQYGINRQDVCAAFPKEVACPAANVGWASVLDTTLLSNGPHTLEVTATAADGTHQTISASFTVAN